MKVLANVVITSLTLVALMLTGCQKPVDVKEEAKGSGEKSAAPDAVEAAPQPVAAEPAATAPAALAQGTDDQKKLLRSALGQVDANELDAAAMTLLVLVKDGPDSLEKLIAFIVLAEIYLTEENFERGITRLEEHRSAFPPTAEYEDALARLYLGAKKMDEGAAALRRAVKADPSRLDLIAKLTHLLHDKGDDDGAKEESALYDKSLNVSFELLRGKEAPLEARVGIIEVFATVRDPRISAVLVEMLAAEDIAIVSAALESIVNSGSKDAVPGMRARAELEERAQVKAGLNDAADYLDAMEKVPELLVMPVEL